MDKVLKQAEILAEEILSSETYISMRVAEQAVSKDKEAIELITEYNIQRQEVEALLAQNPVDHEALSKAGKKLKEIETTLDNHPLLSTMGNARDAFTEMMKQVNNIIKYVVTGEPYSGDCAGGGGCMSGGCSGGGCSSCGGCN